jgi:hypothetical protein
MVIKYRFDKDFDYKVRDKKSGNLLSSVAYKRGMEELIPEDHANAADAAGVGQRVSGATNGNQSAGGPAPAQSKV